MKLQTIVSHWRRMLDAGNPFPVRERGGAPHRLLPRVPGGFANPADWLGDGRYCCTLAPDERSNTTEADLATAWTALEEGMAFVPGGGMAQSNGTGQPAASPDRQSEQAAGSGESGDVLRPFYLDRYAVANADYFRFVADGGYDRIELWSEETWQHVVQFVDETGAAGPRFWRDGRPPRGREKHPVVGVCWYEALAYSRWAGKRLPSAEEWEAAASWPAGPDGRETRLRYPWGNAFSPEKANLWVSGHAGTVEVDRYPAGSTPNGLYQLIGNVWEWVADRYLGPPVEGGTHLLFERAMAEVRGGAFDTYFESQAACRFRTGQPFLYRGANVGFRCAVSTERVGRSPDPSAFFNSRKSS